MEQKTEGNLNTGFLKIVGIVAMSLDHIGKIFLPNIIALQIIGRLAFPLFAYCIVVGALYTGNIKNYALRLGIFAIISQPFYMMTFGRPWNSFNILITLLIGLLATYALKEKKWLIFVSLIIIPLFADINYGLGGLLLMVVFYLFRHKIELSLIAATALLAFSFFSGRPYFYLGNIGISIEGFAVLSVFLIYIRTNIDIKLNKYFFYIFYPAHLYALSLGRLIFRLLQG